MLTREEKSSGLCRSYVQSRLLQGSDLGKDASGMITSSQFELIPAKPVTEFKFRNGTKNPN